MKTSNHKCDMSSVRRSQCLCHTENEAANDGAKGQRLKKNHNKPPPLP